MQTEHLGRLIAEWRGKRGMSQSELAEAAKLTSSSIISRIESGRTALPTLENMQAIARALGAESSLMAVFFASRGSAAEDQAHGHLTIAATHSLFLAPMAMVRLDNVILASHLAPQKDDTIRSALLGLVPIEGNVLRQALADHDCDCIVRPRVAGKGEGLGLHVATLICRFAISGIDLLSYRSCSGGEGNEPNIVSPSDLSGVPEDTPLLYVLNGEGEALLGDLLSRVPAHQKRCIKPQGLSFTPDMRNTEVRMSVARGGRVICLTHEPFTSALAPQFTGAQREPEEERRGSSLELAFEFIVRSERDLLSLQEQFRSLLAQLSRTVSEWADPNRALTASAPSQDWIETFEQISVRFGGSSASVERFFRRANPRWHVLLAPIWLDLGC
jgi:transcriptional regulator with XRE-family HTH domain